VNRKSVIYTGCTKPW